MTKFITCLITFCLTSQLFIPGAYAVVRNDLGGTIEAHTQDGQKFDLPALKTDLEVDVEADLARVTVIQTFINPTKTPLHATYLFPLNKDAAVHGMKMEIGDEIVEAKIKKIEKAKKIFKKAKKEGKAASLLVQHRPNMFTQKIANLIPELPIKVTLEYVQTIPKVDGDYRLVVPLIVGPRYQPRGSGRAPMVADKPRTGEVKKVRSDTAYGQWEIEALPEYPLVFGLDIQPNVDRERVSIKVNMKAGVPFTSVLSSTHELDISGDGNHKVATLAGGRTIDNRDFVLNYRMAGENTQAGLLAHRNGKEGYFSLLIEPPAIPQTKDITPREMVFVLDTSGSMEGEPIAASKVFMRHALSRLRPNDYFRIIHFGDNATELTNGPISATQNNLGLGLQRINSLKAQGGTEIVPAIRRAFSSPRINKTLRIVVFLTDGYIGNESAVLKLINREINGARIYAFGIGTSVNRYLLSEMGRVGRGFARYIDPTEDPEEAAIKLAHKLETPVLTDISIDWKQLKVSEVTPEVIPDLFAGDSIRIQGKFEGEGLGTVQVKGKVKGRKASLPLQLNLPQDNYYEESTSAIPLVWARSKISDYMRQLNTPTKQFSDDELKFKVTTLGLNHSLATKWTSFVAVSRRVVNPQPEITPDTTVPLPMVKGTTKNAYPSSGKANSTKMASAAPATGTSGPAGSTSSILGNGTMKKTGTTPSILGDNMAANSVPEPETLLGLSLLMVAGLVAMWFIRRKARTASSST